MPQSPEHLSQAAGPWPAGFERLHRLSREAPYPDLATRKALLRALRTMLGAQKQAFAAAISKDFGNRSIRETMMSEVVPVLQSIDDALWKLRGWMRPQRKPVALHFLPASNKVFHQPKGLVLIVAPWNYPLQLTLGPLVGALAAGNRVIIKPSELTPRFSELLKSAIEKALGDSHVSVMTGGPDLAAELTALPFDHILFTGSTRVGSKVLRQAAPNLTPVTLELGGKSPAILHESFDFATAARRIARGKLLNAGQTCIAPDYVLAPQHRVEEFALHFANAVEALYPTLLANPDYTSIIAPHHAERLNRLLADAKRKGASVRIIDPAHEFAPHDGASAPARKIAPAVLTGVTEEMDIMREEIFGPLLPVVAYATLEEAVATVRARARPLALYYFDHDGERIQAVLKNAHAGGVTINDTIFHVAQESLPFGGIGSSGMGAYHGEAGFQAFSHAKAVFHQSRLAGTELLNPPYGKRFDFLIAALLKRFGL